MRNVLRIVLALCLSALVASAAGRMHEFKRAGRQQRQRSKWRRLMYGIGRNGRPGGPSPNTTSSGTNRGSNGMMNNGGSNSTDY